MYDKFYFVILIFLSYFFFNFSIKKSILLDNTASSKHKQFASQKKPPLIGGILIFFSFLIFVDFPSKEFFILSLLFLILGIVSDAKILNNANLRFAIQAVLLIIFFTYSDVKILSTRIIVLDDLNSIKLFSVLFCSFCCLILINGFNFIDGLNGLTLGYFVLVLINLLNIQFSTFSEIFLLNNNFIIFLVFILVFILMSKLFLGDSGSYFLGILCSLQIIYINYVDTLISPWYLILLIWYPCFEVLFSIVRKILQKKSAFHPDNNHLHQLLLFFLRIKFCKFKINFNTFSSILLLFYNFIIFYVSREMIYDSIKSGAMIIFNIIIYLIVFFILKNATRKKYK